MTSTNNRAPLLHYITLNSGQNWWSFCPVWPWNFMDDLEKQLDTSSILHEALGIVSKPWVNSNWSYSPETINLGQNRWLFCLVWLWNLTDDLGKQYGTSSILHQDSCIISKPWVNQTGVTVWKCLIWVKIHYFSAVWPWNLMNDLENKWHLFHDASSFVHHFIAISKFKLELQSGNT